MNNPRFIIMIRKVPNMRAWVLKPKDIVTWKETVDVAFCFYLRLPILDTKIGLSSIYGSIMEMDTDYICVIDACFPSFNNSYPVSLTLEQIDAINKTWDKFYHD